MKRKWMVLAVLGIGVAGYFLLRGPSPTPVTAAVSENGGAFKGGAPARGASMSDERRTEALAAFSPSLRQLDRHLGGEYRDYDVEYAKYLGKRDEFVEAMREAGGKNTELLRKMSAELDRALLALKQKSREIGLESGRLNQRILAEFRARQGQ